MKKSRLMAAAGAAAVFVAATALSSLAAHAGIPKRMTAVEATRSIPAGTEIRASELTTVTFHGQPPTGLVTAIGLAAGKLAAHRIAKGEILFQADVSKTVERDGLKPGEVGFMIPVSLVTAAEATPGSRVDVMAGTTASGYGAAAKNAQAVGFVAHSLRVVQVVTSSNTPTQATKTSNGSVLSSGNVPAAVELAVAPQEAQLLAQIQYEGEKLTLVLDPWPASRRNQTGTAIPGAIPGVKGSILPSTSNPAGSAKSSVGSPAKAAAKP